MWHWLIGLLQMSEKLYIVFCNIRLNIEADRDHLFQTCIRLNGNVISLSSHVMCLLFTNT